MVGMKFHKIVFIYIILQFFSVRSVFSQAAPAAASNPDEVKKVRAEMDAQYEKWADEQREQYLPKWDEHVTDMNLLAERLVAENDRLAREQQSLLEEWKVVEADLQKQKNANADLRAEISRKKDLMDDKRWKEKAAGQVKALQQELDDKNKELQELDRQAGSLGKKIQLGQLKLASLGVDVSPIDARLKGEEEITQLRSKLSETGDRERVLKYKLEQFKDQDLDPKVAALRDEIDGLNKKIAEAQTAGRKPQADPQAELHALEQKKADLEQETGRLKQELDKIEKAQAMGIANQRIKALVDDMSAVDVQNNQLREEIAMLKENIAILKGHVKKLEYQADAINAMKDNMGQMDHLNNPFK
jgi:chromosome segregation ATPase